MNAKKSPIQTIQQTYRFGQLIGQLSTISRLMPTDRQRLIAIITDSSSSSLNISTQSIIDQFIQFGQPIDMCCVFGINDLSTEIGNDQRRSSSIDAQLRQLFTIVIDDKIDQFDSKHTRL
jgi:hypothetical protein